MRRPLVVVGDVLLDRDVCGRAERLSPDAPVPVVRHTGVLERPGGAGLAAWLAATDGPEVVLVTALVDDAAGARLRALLGPRVRLLALPAAGGTEVKTRVRADGASVVRLDSGGPARPQPPPGRLAGEVAEALRGAGALLVSDYGHGLVELPLLRQLLATAVRAVPTVWDPHPRGAVPQPGARLVTPNAAEARALAAGLNGAAAGPADGWAGPPSGGGLAGVRAQAEALVARWGVTAVAVTLGGRGALLSFGAGDPVLAPARPVAGGDTCGAGDRFAAAATVALAAGALPSEAVVAAVAAASDFVAAGGVATLPGTGSGAGAVGRRRGDRAAVPGRGDAATGGPDGGLAEALARVAAVRARGGTVVATGGCFDLLHAGHVTTLAGARSLGDCLVVCLNSDASVRRLKGPGRPVVPAEDRRRVLSALASVDAVVVFAEDTPEAVLARLRPDVWVKGGDYAGGVVPEGAAVRSWGGEVVVLPYLAGRSTTRLIDDAGLRAGTEARHTEEGERIRR
ncbi:MAG: D-glycero-beta-D-manno-heptose 1-phosphate adenylyltransferase [Actinomycetota bacterium]